MPTSGALLQWIAQNVEASVAILGLLGSIVAFLISLYLKRKRITYRVHLDLTLGDTPDHRLREMIDVVIRNQGTTVVEPSFALVRIMNTGSTAIRKDDYQGVPLRLRFGGREVLDAQVVEGDQVAADLPRGWPEPSREVVLPIVPLNRRDRVKVLVLLSGRADPNRAAVEVDGFLSGGRIRRDNARGDGPNRRSLLLGGTALVLVGASMAALLVSYTRGSATGGECAAGTVTLGGSTAFAPVAADIMRSYTERCTSATVTVAAGGSKDGILEIDRLGRDDPAERERRIAMTDGPVPAGFPNLVAAPVAVVVFAVAVNDSTGVRTLTTDQVRALHDGRVTNWNQVGGADLPVSLVSRNAGSGTRAAFEQTVLGRSEGATTSDDCVRRRDVDQGAPIIRCERDSTSALLDQVERTPGAVGYAEVSAVDGYPGLTAVELDGRDPNIDAVVRTAYPYWAVEYLATYGPPQDGGLVDRLVELMASDTAKNILRRSGYVPCVDGSIDLRDTLCR